jgi:dimethylargininase
MTADGRLGNPTDTSTLRAITRSVPASIEACELTFVQRRAIDIGRARREHADYVRMMRDLGVVVTVLHADDALPDSVFVEDPVLVLDEIAIALPMAAPARRGEIRALEAAIAPHRKFTRMSGDARMDGGDVLRAGRDLHVGVSTRTNEEAVRQLRDITSPFGYRVVPVAVRGCLHLKTGCTFVGEHVLLNPGWIDAAGFGDRRILNVPSDEPWGANTLTIGDTVLVAGNCPETAALLGDAGFEPVAVDIAELQKAEAGLTCLSVLFAVDG